MYAFNVGGDQYKPLAIAEYGYIGDSIAYIQEWTLLSSSTIWLALTK